MTTQPEALKLALEALVRADRISGYPNNKEVIAAIKEALAQPEHSCVACEGNPKGNNNPCVVCGLAQPEQDYRAMYLKVRDELAELQQNPPHRKPLSDVEIWNTYKNLWMFHPAEEPRLAGDVLKFARAIEAAHGIEGETWVGLTKDEQSFVYRNMHNKPRKDSFWVDFARAIEAKLKEKNT